MMRTSFILTAFSAVAFVACSSDEEMQTVDRESQDLPVAFTSYITTRATDNLDNNATSGLPTRGFGVFAYQQGTVPFLSYYTSATEPNFMKNEKIYSTNGGADWTYSPLKMWSNDTGARHSFFAYAPYSKGGASILKTYPNSPSVVFDGVNDGPAIYYAAPDNLADVIDLCWGDYNETGHAAVDLAKPGIDEKIKFTFRHALARISFNAQLWADEARPDADHNGEGNPANVLDDATKVTIKSIKLIGTMSTGGYLRLYDGKWNAEYVSNKQIEMADYFAINPYVLDNIKQEQPLFGTGSDYFTILPGGSFKIRIEYDVTTTDAKLEGGKSTVTNIITSDVSYPIESGKSYQFHLNIGLTSVKFDAEVQAWTSTTDMEEIDVPANKN